MNRQSVLISKKTFLVLILLIFLLGFALRAVEILSGDFVFLFDQGRDYLDVRKIVVEHKLTLIGPHTGIGGVFTGPGWYYLGDSFYFVERSSFWRTGFYAFGRTFGADFSLLG